jgi:chemotaxis protein CheD
MGVAVAQLRDDDRAAPLPQALPGFAHINRYWDGAHGSLAAKLLPGEYYVTTQQELIVTVLGSCVSACVRDTRTNIGGMNHFMLPANGSTAAEDSWKSTSTSAATRYGNYAMEHLINTILKYGGSRGTLEVKVFGGGRILAGMTDVGRRNIAFIEDYLRTEGLKMMAGDLGDTCPRKVVYDPLTGRVRMKRLRSLHNDTIVQREAAYMNDINRQPVEGEIDLF